MKQSRSWAGALVVCVIVAASLCAAPQVAKKEGVYVLENALLRAEVKITELQRLVYKPTGQELMTPTYHGVLFLLAAAKQEKTVHYLNPDSFSGNRRHETVANEQEGTITTTFDWGWSPGGGELPYAVKQEITMFGDRPYLRVRYLITVKSKPAPVPGTLSVFAERVRGTHFVEPGDTLRVEKLGSQKAGGMHRDPNNYWFAFWDEPTGHFTATLRPGQTDPARCRFLQRGGEGAGQWGIAVYPGNTFIEEPGQTFSEELWLVGGQTGGEKAEGIPAVVKEAYDFIAQRQSIKAALGSDYLPHEKLVEQTKHLRADGKGDRIVFKNERLYVDGKPFLLFAPWGASANDFPLYKKYHLTGVLAGTGDLDACAKNGLMQVAILPNWRSYRAEQLEQEVERIKDHPALLAWFLADDFGGDLEMLGYIESIRKHETHIPTVVDTVGADAARRRSGAFVDIQSPYEYPVARMWPSYRAYAESLDHNRKVMDRQFNWTCPETINMTAAKIRLETYIGLAHGIRGFMFWPGDALVDHRLAELGVVCLETEPLTDLIVEAEAVVGGASCDNKQIEVQRLDWGDHVLLFLVNYRPESLRWPDGELTPPATVTVSNVARPMRAYSMTLDKEFKVGEARRVGADLQVGIEGLDAGAMVLLTTDASYAERCQRGFESRQTEAASFAATANRYMSWEVYEILLKLARMRAPVGRGAELYRSALQQIEAGESYTDQRRADRLLRQSLSEALSQADALIPYAPKHTVVKQQHWHYGIPEFMASFNFRALTGAEQAELPAPPYIAPTAGLLDVKPQRMAVGEVAEIAGGSSPDTVGFAVALQANVTYAAFESKGRKLGIFPDRVSYERGQVRSRWPKGFEEFAPLPVENDALDAFLFRPAEAMDLHIVARGGRAPTPVGVVQAQPLPLQKTLAGPTLSPKQPLAVYEAGASKGDSFEVTVAAQTGGAVCAYLSQAHARHSQVLAGARIAAGQSERLRCTLPDDGPLVVVVTHHTGSGEFSVTAQRIAEQVLPQLTATPFTGVKFGIFGAEPAPFRPHLAAGGITGDRLDGKLAEADLSRYDVIILLTNALRNDKAGELKANAERLRRFVQDGGGMVLFQQSPTQTEWTDSILPYRMELFAKRTLEPPVMVEPRLFAGSQPSDMAGENRTVGFHPIKLDGATDKEWRVLAYSDATKAGALAAACSYGKGRTIINQFAILDRVTEPAMHSMMVETVRYVLPPEKGGAAAPGR